MNFERLRPRLTAGRPLVLDGDVCASFRARGTALDGPGAMGLLLRQRPDEVLAHYRAELGCSIDVLSALTADTTPRALAEVGMEHRSAALTGLAVELALEAAASSPKPVAVAGVLGSEMLSPIAAHRVDAEVAEHAARLAAAGCDLILARGQGARLGLMTAVAAAAATDLPTLAVVEVAGDQLLDDAPLTPLLEALAAAGATAVLFEVEDEAAGAGLVRRAADLLPELPAGVLLAAGIGSVRGHPDLLVADHIRRWAEGLARLDGHGARLVGGGAGTSEQHTSALAAVLGALHPSLPPRA